MKLHNVLDQVSKRFSHLEGKLKHAPKGSEEFKVRFYTIHDIVWIVDYAMLEYFNLKNSWLTPRTFTHNSCLSQCDCVSLFQNVKARILQEYERNKQDKTYQDARSNFQYLHEKLAHIKKLVHDFDTARVGQR